MEAEQVASGSSHGDLHVSPLCRELYFLIAKFLCGGPCQRAGQALVEELELNEILPKSVNWLGEAVSQDFKTYSSKFDNLRSDHLLKLLEQLQKTINAKETTLSKVSRSLLTPKIFCDESFKRSKTQSWSKLSSNYATIHRDKRRKLPVDPVSAVLQRETTGDGPDTTIIKPEFFQRMHQTSLILGHLSSVFCVSFDMSGKYVFTGADDKLVKVWSAINGRLLATIRGLETEVSDIAVNQENTMLAVASCDRIIHVWCLKTCAPIAELHGQNGTITSVFFCPIPRSRSIIRYLASTSSDGSCAFWAYTDEPGEPVQFQPKPTLYLERMRPGNAKMLCSAFSAGGLFMAAGSADNNVRVYHMLGPEGPERILEVEYHKDNVDSISWAHNSIRFISGSKDCTALIWRFENSCWKFIRLYCSKLKPSSGPVVVDAKKPPRVTMVGWSRDDAYVFTAVSDLSIKVWNSVNGELFRTLNAHGDEIFVLEAHPFSPDIFFSAGHDGKIIIWDIRRETSQESAKVYEYINALPDNQGCGAIFDCKWSPDGFSIAATNSHGYLIRLSTTYEDDKFKKLPEECFFHTDYRPIMRDAVTNEIIDEQTNTPVYLMPPPFLVDMEGNPYPPDIQRLVPGRENIHQDFLIPNVAVDVRGMPQVIQEAQAPARSNIDEMIQRLAAEQGLGGDQNVNDDNEEDGRGVGLRRSGEVEGIRQTRGNWQNGEYDTRNRIVVAHLNPAEMEQREKCRLNAVEAEESYYNEHVLRHSPVNEASSSGQNPNIEGIAENTSNRTRRIRQLTAVAAETRRVNPNAVVFEEPQMEGIARPNPRPQLEIVSHGPRPNNSALRRRPISLARRRVSGVGGMRRRVVRYDVARILDENHASDIENVEVEAENNSSDEEVNITEEDSDSSESESSDSDWGGTLRSTRRNRENNSNTNPKREADYRTRSQRVSNSSPSPERPEEESPSEPRPGPSRLPEPVANASNDKEVKRPARPRKARREIDYSVGLEEIPEKYRPSEWFAELFPRRSPYFPQLGDDLVYYRQGHEMYMREVENKKIYEITKKIKKNLPYVMKPDLEPEVSVRVVGLKFEIEPPRVAVLKLAKTDWETGEPTNEHFYVKYHDVPDVVDFLILRQMYNKCIRRRWNPGDRFRCLIQREWWLGTIVAHEPWDSNFQDSHYMCYKVKWDNGDPERMSPWDMDTIPSDFVIPENSSEGIPASDDDLRIGLYEPTPSDWPPHGHQDTLCQLLSSRLEQVMELAISEPFLTPVDLNAYPQYAQIIAYPVDLTSIKARLDNRYYRRLEVLKFDIVTIAQNAEQFNEINSDIVKQARIVKDVLLDLLRNPNQTNINPAYQKASKHHAKEAERARLNNNNNKPSSSKATLNEKSKSTPRKSPRKARLGYSDNDGESDWTTECKKLLESIWKKGDAQPFRYPVDDEEHPDYKRTVDRVICLRDIREDLAGGNYDSVKEFHKDMMQIFINSKQYNTNKRSKIYIMTVRLQSLYEYQIQPILRRSKKRSARKPAKSGRLRSETGSLPTPRKNPRRNVKSTPMRQSYSNDYSSDEESISPGPSPRRPISSNNSSSPAVSTRSRNGLVNGHSLRNYETRSHFPKARPVKRLRIMSNGTSPSPSRSAAKRRKEQAAASYKRRIQPIKKEPEETEDEFEDSEIEMPTLEQPGEEDYTASEADSDEEYVQHQSGLRRTARTRIKREVNDDNHCYGTRFRGKHVRSYVESDEDESRRNSNKVTSPSRVHNLRSSQPPVLKRKLKVLTDESDAESDQNEPGPSSRFIRGSVQTSPSRLNSKKLPVKQESEEDEEEEVEENEFSDNSEESEEAELESKPQLRERRPLRPRQNVSDDDDYIRPAPRKKRKLSTSSYSARPSRASANSVDYAEESDSDPPTQISYSSRGRLRRTKNFLGD